MVSTFTPNVQIEEPARGDYIGTWDTPVNANMTLIDLILGGRVTISGAAGSVVLAAAQFQSKTITFNSTLGSNITVTFPTSFTKSYEVYHSCTGSSAFTITLQTTAAGGQVVAIPPGEICEVLNDGTNIRFKNFGRVGSFWEYGGSSVPNWVSACTVAPYLNCDATSFSSATYPQLATLLGGTALPDSRGRVRAALNQGTGRLTSSQGGVDGNTNLTAGGVQTTTLSSVNMPPIPISDPSHTHATGGVGNGAWVRSGGGGSQSGGGAFGIPDGSVTILNSLTGITAGNASPAFFSNVMPTFVGGLTLIRSA